MEGFHLELGNKDFSEWTVKRLVAFQKTNKQTKIKAKIKNYLQVKQQL